jgi:phosphohistidine phosphatase SixA
MAAIGQMAARTYMDGSPFDLEIRTMRLALAFVLSAFFASQCQATEVAWAKLLEGGHTILLRHAFAPGIGDPANFKLDDCTTQRNLSDDGRQQAQRIGARFAARAIKVEVVLTSQWCRAKDTAKLAFPRIKITEEPVLNSFFADTSKKDEQTAAALKLIRAFEGSGNQVMVTHQVNIEALTGLAPREGEAIIIDADTNGVIKVLGRQMFD